MYSRVRLTSSRLPPAREGALLAAVVQLADPGQAAVGAAVQPDGLHGRHGELDADVLLRIVRGGDGQAHRGRVLAGHVEGQEVALRRADRVGADDDAEALPNGLVRGDFQDVGRRRAGRRGPG